MVTEPNAPTPGHSGGEEQGKVEDGEDDCQGCRDEGPHLEIRGCGDGDTWVAERAMVLSLTRQECLLSPSYDGIQREGM